MLTDGRTDGRTYIRTDERTNERTDERTDERKLARLCLPAKAGATKIRLGCKCVLSDQSSAFDKQSTQKCLSIRTPKTINFPFVSNGKLIVSRCPNIQAH